jgi:hypothetical protein
MALLAAKEDEQLLDASETLGSDLIKLVDPAMNVKIVLHPEGEERSLCVKSDKVQKGDIVFKIPIRIAISADSFDRIFTMAGKTDAQVPTYETENELKKQFLLLLHASYDLSASPLLRAYHSSLPPLRSFDHLPFNWKSEQLAKFGPLFSPMLQSYVNRAKKEEAAMFSFLSIEVRRLNALHPSLFSDNFVKGLTHSWLWWAFSITNSRTVDLVQRYKNPLAAEENNPGLLPILDMMNHAFGEKATVKISLESHPSTAGGVDTDETFMCARATTDLKPNDELCFEYQKGEEILHYLFYYGFLPSERDKASELMYFQIKIFDEEKEEMSDAEQQSDGFALYTRALASLGLPASPTLALPASSDQPFPAAWIWILRLKAMYDEKSLDQLQDFIDGNVKILATQEELAWTTIGETLKEYIEWYEKALACTPEELESATTRATAATRIEDARDSDVRKLVHGIRLIAMSVLVKAHAIFLSTVTTSQ